MPFTLAIESIDKQNEHLKIKGKITSGSFFGAEAIELFTNSGKAISGIISGHSLIYPIAHPVLPEHEQTRIYLNVYVWDEIDISQMSDRLSGLGTVFLNENRLDISSHVTNPIFWGYHFNEFMLDEDGEYLYQDLLGVTTEEVNNYYLNTFRHNFQQNTWLFVNIKLDRFRSIEIEYACGIENQTRYWIRYKDDLVLLGYQSPHFSLPGIRLEEIKKIANKLGKAKTSHLSLLLLPCCYLTHNDLLNDLQDLFSAIQKKNSFLGRFLKGNKKNNSIVEHFTEYLRIPDLAWQEDVELGWINNWQYSQRNPNSLMRIISDEEYLIIKKFFAI